MRRSSSSLTSPGGLCHFAVLRSLLIWLALCPPTSSVPGVPTPLASVNPKDFKARETCCWSGSYSILTIVAMSVFCPRNSLFVTATDSGPRVTTLLGSYAPRNKLSACFRPSCRSTKKNHRAPDCTSPAPCGRSTDMPRPGKIIHSPKLERNALLIVWLRPKIRAVSFAVSHAHWLFCLGVLVWQSDVDITHRISAEVGSTHVCNEDQESVLDSKKVFLTRNIEQDSQIFQRRCCREHRFDPFMTHLRAHQTRTVTWSFSASFVGIDPLEANWIASCFCSCLRFFGVLVHLHVPQILKFLRTGSFDVTGSNSPQFTSSSASHSSGGFLHPYQPQGCPTSAKAGDVAVDREFQQHPSLIEIAGTMHS